MTDDEPKEPKHEPTVPGVGAMRPREATVLGVAPPANAAPAAPAAAASMREATILGLGDGAKPASPPVPPAAPEPKPEPKPEPDPVPKPSEPKLAPLPAVAPARATPRRARDDASLSVEPAGVPRRAGGGWKVVLLLVIAGGGVAAYLERDRIMSEPTPTATTPPPPEPPEAAAAPLPVPSVDAEVEKVAVSPDVSGLDASAIDAGRDAGNHIGTKDAGARKDAGASLDLHPHAKGATTAHPAKP